MEKMNAKYCVYAHINKTNGKIYIGQTNNIIRRWQGKGNNYKTCSHFYHAIKKYGWDNFQHLIIVDNLCKEEADILEMELIKKYQTQEFGYNITDGGAGGKKGFGSNNGHAKQVRCLETNQIFSTVNKAAEWAGVGAPTLSSACSGRKLSAGGYHWVYEKDYLPDTCQIKTPKKNKFATKIECVETGEIFLSMGDAAKAKGLKTHTDISRCCNGIRNTAGGYHWRYAGEVQDIV